MLGKIILLIVVVCVAWFGWRWLNRVQTIGRERLAEREKQGRREQGGKSGAQASASRSSGANAAEDMEKCAECGAYVVARLAGRCGRPGCPYD